MKRANHTALLVLAGLATTLGTCYSAQDWPQWRGPNRDDKASGFDAPKTWPLKLNEKWRVTVGKGDASPAVVDGKVYAFARQDADELLACLDAATGKEVWREKYESQAAAEPMGRHPGPRSSPAVAAGKVVTYGARGILSCFDAANGKLVWRKDDLAGTWPRFFTSASPLITDGLCIAQLGSEDKGGIFAYDLSSGIEKWKWTADGTAYSSPTLLTVGGTKMLVAMTAKRIIGLGITDGKLLWEVPFAVQGRAYNAATPIVDGQNVIFAGSGRGTKAVKIEKSGDGFTATDLWSNQDNAVQFNTPVLKSGQLYGLSQKGDLFCLDAQTGKTLWTSNLGGKDFGSIVDTGSSLVALTPGGRLTVFEPSDKAFKELASYKVAESPNETYAHPVLAGSGIYIKDQETVALWSPN
ncbi:MAG TPA: PQQ-binding-like beta-propeller repeat protein [Verrucomicrobiae bacterium]